MIVEQAKKTIGSTWYVYSENVEGASHEIGPEKYIVHHKVHPRVGDFVWTCNCLDFTERKQWAGESCKHIVEVRAKSNDGGTHYIDGKPFTILDPVAFRRGAEKYARYGYDWLANEAKFSLNDILEAVVLLRSVRENS